MSFLHHTLYVYSPAVGSEVMYLATDPTLDPGIPAPIDQLGLWSDGVDAYLMIKNGLLDTDWLPLTPGPDWQAGLESVSVLSIDIEIVLPFEVVNVPYEIHLELQKADADPSLAMTVTDATVDDFTVEFSGPTPTGDYKVLWLVRQL